MALSTEFLPYIFGPGTGETLESIAKKRQIAEALLARSGTPKNVGEGLTAVGNALASVILERRAAAGEKAGQAGVDPNGLVAKWLSGGDLDEITSGAPSPVPGVPPSPAPVVPSPSIARPPSAGPVENVPAGWGAGGSFAPPAGAPSAAAPTAGVASPTGFSGSKQAFVQMMMPAAIELSKKTGLDPRLIVAQAAQETGFGQHAPGGNYFGIKSHGVPGGQTLRTTEFAGGQPHAENASFRTYSGPEASVRGYGDFLQQNPRYAPMLAAQGLDAQLAALGKSGYATDPNYAASVGAIARGIPQGGPTQVASLDPSVGLPPPPTAVQKVAAAMPGAPSAGPEMANAGMPPVSGPGMLPPPFVPPSVPTGVMPTRGVQSVAGALAPPAPPPVAPMQPPQGAPPAGGTRAPSPAVVRQALENLNNPFANAGVKAQAMEVLKRADPSYQLEQKMKEAQYQNLVNPKPTGEIQNFEYGQTHPGFLPPKAPDTVKGYDKDGREVLLRWDAAKGDFVPVGGAKTPDTGTPSALTKLIDERNARFATNPSDPNIKLYDQRIAREAAGEKGWSIETSPDGSVSLTQGDVGDESGVEAAARAKATPKMFADIAGDLPAADALAQSVGQLGSALQGVEVGASPAFLEWIRKTTGVALGPQADKRQAVESIIDYLTPRMRVPGSGATSDMEMRTFKNALPSLMGTPGGNKIIVDTLSALTERRVRIAQIAQDYLVGVVNSKEALDQMRALPDSFAAFKAAATPTSPDPLFPDLRPAPGGPLPSAGGMGTGADRPGGMPPPPAIGEVQRGYRYKGGDPASPASWEKL